MSKFTDYMEAVQSEAGVVLDWRIELVSPSGSLLASDDPSRAVGSVLPWQPEVEPMEFAITLVSQRSGTISVPVTDDRLVPGHKGSLLHPDTQNRVKIQAGLWSATGSKFWTLATLVVFEVTAELNGPLKVQLVDRLRPAHSNLIHGFSFDAGTPVETVVARLLGDVYSAEDFQVSPTGWTLPPGSFDAGENRMELITQMLEGCGHELVATPDGKIITREIPPSTVDPGQDRWDYGGADGIVVDWASRTWTIHSPQGWKVEGGSYQDDTSGFSIVVYGQDPVCQGYFGSGGEVTIGQSKFPYTRSVLQAAVAGYAQLRRNGSGPFIVEFDAIPNPAMAEGDPLMLHIPEIKVSGLCRVVAFSLPVQADGLMRVTARGSFDPSKGYQFPIDRGEGCLVARTDTFDRPNENLENIPTGGGSPDWTEIGYSWGVEGNQAVQRYNGGWSMAFLNTPMCATDHYAEIEVAKIPSGRFLGPAVRGSGAFDGYVAMADSAGNINLELWLDKKKISTLGSYWSGGPVEGKRLRVTAEGSTISVKLASETVITVNDDRRTGAYVGMAALGGQQPNAPAVDEFVCGNA